MRAASAFIAIRKRQDKEWHRIHTTFDDIMGAEADEEELGNFFGGLKSFLDG